MKVDVDEDTLKKISEVTNAEVLPRDGHEGAGENLR